MYSISSRQFSPTEHIAAATTTVSTKRATREFVLSHQLKSLFCFALLLLFLTLLPSRGDDVNKKKICEDVSNKKLRWERKTTQWLINLSSSFLISILLLLFWCWPYVWTDDGRKFAELFIWYRRERERLCFAVCYSHEKISNYTLFPLILIHNAFLFYLLSLITFPSSSFTFAIFSLENYCVLYVCKKGKFRITFRFTKWLSVGGWQMLKIPIHPKIDLQ